MKRKILAVTTIICLITFLGIITGARAETIDIEGPWLWMIAPVPFNEGGEASIDFDSLAEASCDVVDEQMIATHGANVGDWVGIYQWTEGKISVERPGWLDLSGNGNINDCLETIGMIKGNVDHATAYALINIHSPMAQAAWIKVGSDDAIKVWLNGFEVHRNKINRSTKGYQEKFQVNLKKDANLLMVKVCEQESKWRMFIGVDVPNPHALVFRVPQRQAGVQPPHVPQIKNRPVVRLIHFVPNGKEYDLDKKHEELKKKMEHVKAFYQCTMQDFGYITFDVDGTKRFGKTFNFDSKPYVIEDPVKTEQDWLAMDDRKVFNAVWDEIQAAWDPNWGVFDPTTDIYLAIMEGNYVDGIAGQGEIGQAISYNINWFTIAHELGHAFGLRHNFGDARYMMSYCNHTVWGCDTTDGASELFSAIHGFFSTDHCDKFDFDNRRISQETAEWLTVHRAFNPPQVANDDPARIKIVEPVNGIILKGTTTFSLVVHYADNDLPHQIQLYVPVTEAEPFASPDSMKLHRAKPLRGGYTAWKITYSNFSDVMADQDIIKINIRTIDSYGNMTSTWHTLIKAERADIDENGKVDAGDVDIVTEILHGREPPADYADVNGDGNVDVHDLTLVKNAREDRGSPPVVRLHYVYPKGGIRNRGTEQDFVEWAEEAQAFYRAEMERHGFGSKTFQLDTEVRVHELEKTKEELHSTSLSDQDNMNELFKRYIEDTDGAWDIHLFFVDVDKTGGYPGAAAYEHRMAYTTVKDDSASATIAHELGHNFVGFMIHRKPEIANINGIDKYPIMSINCPNPPKIPGDPQCEGGLSNPIELQFLSRHFAIWLNKYPLFNFLAPSTDNEETKLSFLNMRKIEGEKHEFTGEDKSGIKFKVEDSDGIDIVATGIMDSALQKVVSEYSLNGDGDGEITFRVSLPQQKDHKILFFYIAVIDNLGNIKIFGGYGGQGDRIQIPIDWEPSSDPASPSLVFLSSVETSLLPNYPNPFNPETWIPYQLSKPADVTLTIYDIQGRVVRDLDLGHQGAGTYHGRSRAAHWDGRNAQGEPVASGLYFYTLKAGEFTATRKMLVQK